MPTSKPDAMVIRARWALLAINARWRDGLYRSAMQAAGARSTPELLRDIGRGGKKLTVDERAFLYELLLAIGDGRDVVKALRITPRKVGHRERSLLGLDIAREVRRHIKVDRAPPGEAIAAVATIVGKANDAVRKDYERYLPELERMEREHKARARTDKR